MIDLSQLVSAAQQLDPLPASATRLAALVADVESDLGEVVKVVQLDQALASRVLRLANSAASGASRTIGTVREAVVRIGAGNILSLSVAGAVGGRLRAAIPEYGLPADASWRHSVAAALAPEAIRAVCKVPVDGEAFTAALLHDIGKLVMAGFLEPERISLIARAQSEGGLSPLAAEQEVLGVHHAELGGLIAQQWRLPQKIVDGITFHHSPSADLDRICDVVFVANQVAQASEVGRSPSEPVTAPAGGPQPGAAPAPAWSDEGGAWKRLGLTQARFEEITQRVTNRFGEALALFS